MARQSGVSHGMEWNDKFSTAHALSQKVRS
jgi:hypothetical protein